MPSTGMFFSNNLFTKSYRLSLFDFSVVSYSLMNNLVKNGISIILVSSELPEVMGMSDRIIVMYEGRKNRVFDRGEATAEEILLAAMGNAKEEKKIE